MTFMIQYGNNPLCQLPMPDPKHPKNPLITTYCMRPAGHKGKCEIEAQKEDKNG
jgi:hypothetical protein